MPVWAWVLIGVVLAVCLAVLVYFLVSCRRRRRAASSTQSVLPESVPGGYISHAALSSADQQAQLKQQHHLHNPSFQQPMPVAATGPAPPYGMPQGPPLQAVSFTPNM